jgi:hypothetical protein
MQWELLNLYPGRVESGTQCSAHDDFFSNTSRWVTSHSSLPSSTLVIFLSVDSLLKGIRSSLHPRVAQSSLFKLSFLGIMFLASLGPQTVAAGAITLVPERLSFLNSNLGLASQLLALHNINHEPILSRSTGTHWTRGKWLASRKPISLFISWRDAGALH